VRGLVVQVEELLGSFARFAEKTPVKRAAHWGAVLDVDLMWLAANEFTHECGVRLIEGYEAPGEIIILGKGSRGEYEGQGRAPHTPDYHIGKYECW
jgi:hypothetical protein